MELSKLNKKIAVVINRDGMGEAPTELSHLLVKNYLTLLSEEERTPAYICMYGNGVKLACEGSNVLEELRALEGKGCKVIICKTCLTFNNLLEKVKAGSIGTMLDIIDIQHNCTKLINL
ncbi:MAG: DsrE family protein [Bacteroidales bacterium]|nr:DsrE family protein [Bacteroidales bacterium]MDD3990162.1 DsrE family protein [Bacteroidales bacterium]